MPTSGSLGRQITLTLQMNFCLLRKSTDLCRLGDVYFNQSHTLALTAFATFCGSTCGTVRWTIFDKLSAAQMGRAPLGLRVHRSYRWYYRESGVNPVTSNPYSSSAVFANGSI